MNGPNENAFHPVCIEPWISAVTKRRDEKEQYTGFSWKVKVMKTIFHDRMIKFQCIVK